MISCIQSHETTKQNSPDLLGDDNHHKLVCTSAQGEGKEHRDCLGEPTVVDQRCVDMTQKEAVNWFVPFPRKFIPGSRVPPVN